MTNFKAGDKVVCIAKSWYGNGTRDNDPQFGHIYLVQDVHLGTFDIGEEALGLKVSGCICFELKKFLFIFKNKGKEKYYEARCFRNLITATERAQMEREARI